MDCSNFAPAKRTAIDGRFWWVVMDKKNPQIQHFVMLWQVPHAQGVQCCNICRRTPWVSVKGGGTVTLLAILFFPLLVLAELLKISK